MKYILFFTFFICLSFLVGAASPRSPYPYYHVPNGNSAFCLEVVPITNTKNAKIRCMTIDWGDTVVRKQVWEVAAEYPYPGEVFLAHNGEAMVCLRIPNGLVRHDELKDWIFLKFYVKGKLVSETLLSQIIDTSLLKVSPFFTPGYELLAKGSPDLTGVISGRSARTRKLIPAEYKIAENDDLLHFSTVQKRSFFFRMSDGKLILEIKK